MTHPRFDVLAIGNAIVDVIASASDTQIIELGLNKGGMTLMDAARADELYAAMGPGREISGGSAANTLAGLANLGHRCAFIGQVADDQLGEVFSHDIRAGGTHFDVPAREGEPSTARCLIFVTPDGQRTMNTFLGASQFLPSRLIDKALIQDAAVLYLEGYLWDPEEPRAAMRAAIVHAREAGRKVALTPSEVFVIDRHRADFLQLIEEGLIDILFANEHEIAALAQCEECEEAIAQISAKVPVLVVTKSAAGAVALSNGERFEVAAEPIDKVVDTTGAGDLFAAGFLAGWTEDRPLDECLTMGAVAAAEVIQHYGARPEADLKALVKARLG